MLLAPAKTPRAIVERLHDKIASVGLIPNPPMSIEETQA
jgi:hypothetical protein